MMAGGMATGERNEGNRKVGDHDYLHAGSRDNELEME